MNSKLQFGMSQDAKQMIIEITPEGSDQAVGVVVDALDLDNVIFNLGTARAKMDPPIPRKLDPKPMFRNMVKGGMFHISMSQVIPTKKPDVLMAVHHPGLGWIAYALAPDKAMELAAHLANWAAHAGTNSPLVGLDGKPL